MEKTQFKRVEVKAEQGGRGALRTVENILTFHINSHGNSEVMDVLINLIGVIISQCIYLYQPIMLNILNIFFICQSDLSKAGREKDWHKHWLPCRKQSAAAVGGVSLYGLQRKVNRFC